MHLIESVCGPGREYTDLPQGPVRLGPGAARGLETGAAAPGGSARKAKGRHWAKPQTLQEMPGLGRRAAVSFRAASPLGGAGQKEETGRTPAADPPQHTAQTGSQTSSKCLPEWPGLCPGSVVPSGEQPVPLLSSGPHGPVLSQLGSLGWGAGSWPVLWHAHASSGGSHTETDAIQEVSPQY